jgi:glycosyltransferase involved in cell wall biosynthesis
LNRKKVLIICMFDSIHTAHWIERVKDLDIDYQLFPSKKHKRVHPRIRELLSQQKNINVATGLGKLPIATHGYLDFFIERFQKKLLQRNFRLGSLIKIVSDGDFDFIHALEIQGAGYLCAEINFPNRSKLIVTNWGSDIYFYKNDASHAKRLQGLLAKTDRYSAECIRDYKLASELGFRGVELPVVPNSGGNYEVAPEMGFFKRDLVVVKTYGGLFGRGDLAIQAVDKLLKVNDSYDIFFYSVGKENLQAVKKLRAQFPSRVEYSTVSKGIPHDKLMELFKIAKIYLGCSESDGISTSFLEAISHGVYPIQTNTSCADEWLTKGIRASLVPLDQEAISEELIRVAFNWVHCKNDTINNLRIARNALDPKTIEDKSKEFYFD